MKLEGKRKQNPLLRNTIIIVATIISIGAVFAWADDGDFDNSFGLGGIVTHHGASGGNSDDFGFSVAIQSDSKIVVVGGSQTINFWGNPRPALALWRYNANGTLDNTFGTSGVVTYGASSDTSVSGYSGFDIAIQSDSRIVVSGYWDGQLAVCRFNASGTLDSSFGTGGIAILGSGVGSGVAINSDSKIIVVGRNGATSFVYQLNANGAFDTAFGSGGGITLSQHPMDVLYRVAIQADGKILAVGYTSFNGNIVDLAIWRFNTDGTSDNSFGSQGFGFVSHRIPGSFYDVGRDVAIQPNGRIVVTGAYEFGGKLIRLGTSGSLDNTFGASGVVTFDNGGEDLGAGGGYGIAIQPDGKIVSAGLITKSGSSQLAVWRFNSNGAIDISFGSNGVVTYDRNIAIQYGNYRLGGYADVYWGSDGIGIALLSDSKIVVAANRSNGADLDLAVWRIIGKSPYLRKTTMALPSTTSETFVQVNMSGGGTTAGGAAGLISASLAGANSNYTCTAPIATLGETRVLDLWTNQTSMTVFLNYRSDISSLFGAGLPVGIPDNAIGRQALGATTLLLEVADSTGTLLGDSQTTTNIGDSFAYNLRYFLSPTTVSYYRSLGFNTSPGSGSFRFYYADTYGGRWFEDTTVTVTVRAAAAPAELEILVFGIRKDLPGGLGGVASAASSSSSSAAAPKGACLIQQLAPPYWVLQFFRQVRDTILESLIGRTIVGFYYAASAISNGVR